MILYFLPLFICFISFGIPRLRASTAWYCFFLIYICVFLCFGYMCGSDWRAYEPMYEDLDYTDPFSTYFLEPGYGIWMCLFKSLGISFWPYFITTKILMFAIIANVITKYASDYKYLAWMFFIYSSGYFLFIDNPARNLMAIGVFLLSVNALINRSFIKYLIYMLVAMSFHITAIIMLPLYFILNGRMDTRYWVIIILISWILFINPNIMTDSLSLMTGVSPYVANKFSFYFESENDDAGGNLFSFGMLINLVFCILALLYRNKIEECKNGKIVFNSAMLFFILYRIGSTIFLFYRFQLYVWVFYAIAIAYLCTAFTLRCRKLYLFALFSLSLLVTSQLKYIPKFVPYTNYLEYVIKGEYPSYSYRSDYNYRNNITPNP